jgi:glutamyl-tRNA reductase
MQPLRYGVIGAGVIANHMARVFTEGRGSVAVAVADLNLEAAQKLAAAAGAGKVLADYHTLLADPEVEAVYIATPQLKLAAGWRAQKVNLIGEPLGASLRGKTLAFAPYEIISLRVSRG